MGVLVDGSSRAEELARRLVATRSRRVLLHALVTLAAIRVSIIVFLLRYGGSLDGVLFNHHRRSVREFEVSILWSLQLRGLADLTILKARVSWQEQSLLLFIKTSYYLILLYRALFIEENILA